VALPGELLQHRRRARYLRGPSIIGSVWVSLRNHWLDFKPSMTQLHRRRARYLRGPSIIGSVWVNPLPGELLEHRRRARWVQFGFHSLLRFTMHSERSGSATRAPRAQAPSRIPKGAQHPWFSLGFVLYYVTQRIAKGVALPRELLEHWRRARYLRGPSIVGSVWVTFFITFHNA